MRIRNEAHATKPTRHLYDEELMGDEYERPGITFSREDGVARVKKDVGEALVAEHPHLTVVDETEEPSADDGETADADSSEEAATQTTQE